LAARHLLDLGHRRLAWILPPGQPPQHVVAQDRARGFIETARQAGATAIMTQDPTATGDATGIGCHHDPLAHQVLIHLAQRGLRVPAECSVVGIDGTGPDDGLTTVVYPMDSVAAAAAAILAGRKPPPIAPATLRAGRTTGPLRA
jgi:LacI family transcriptional regulator